jgi:predicted ArsR family transcriptional regulator
MIEPDSSDKCIQDNVASLARKLAPELGEELLSLPRLLNTIIFCLNEKGYKASWETHRDGPVIIFRNCPYLPLVASHPVVCQIDIQILKELLGDTYQITGALLRKNAFEQSNVCKFTLQTR